LLAILIALAAAAGQPLPGQWAQFSRSPPSILLRGVSATVDIATGTRNNDGKFPYKLRLTTRIAGRQTEVKWTDSARCPAVRAVIASMVDIKPPSPAPYGVRGKSDIIVTDETEYTITAPSSDDMGTLTINSVEGSGLSAWVELWLRQLDPCWRPSAS